METTAIMEVVGAWTWEWVLNSSLSSGRRGRTL